MINMHTHMYSRSNTMLLYLHFIYITLILFTWLHKHEYVLQKLLFI